MTSQRRTTRSKKEVSNTQAVVKPKFQAPSFDRINEFTPSESQRKLINKIRSHTLTFVDAQAASGKTSAVLWHYCKEYLNDNTKQIVVIRTPVENNCDKIGFLPNSEQEKLAPHFASAKGILEKFLGKGRVETDLNHRIHFKVPNFMLGATITNSLVLIDEAQALQPMILKLLLERIGENSKVVVAGCSDQIYSRDRSRNALADAIQRFFYITEEYVEAKYPDIALHEFPLDECHRHDIVRSVILAYRGV